MELSRNFKVLLNLGGAKVKITYSIFDDASHSVAKHEDQLFTRYNCTNF